MSLWKEILMLGAISQSEEARALLALELPQSLRQFDSSSQGSREYKGALPQAVRRFSLKAPEQDRSLIQSFEREFIDYLLDDIITGVEKPLTLIELCLADPTATITELAEIFPWEAGLKRSKEWKESWIADHLCSFLEHKIPLPPEIVATLGNRGKAIKDFDEVAFACAPERLELSWEDFKKRQGYGSMLISILDETGDAMADEGFDYGVVPMAEIVLQSTTPQDVMLGIDLQILGRRVSDDLAGLLEEIHARKPADGYRPIAWHNVFWNLISEYDQMRLTIETRDPLRETDQELADHIKANYEDVTSASRPVIYRRRSSFSAACEGLIRERFVERFSRREQTRPAITHVIGGELE
ncbi:MAG: hypothetical protein J2P31_03450 [Blastocatellia bacterium]|nr:hypothetical protein [Blastocatellia bacterium]